MVDNTGKRIISIYKLISECDVDDFDNIEIKEDKLKDGSVKILITLSKGLEALPADNRKEK